MGERLSEPTRQSDPAPYAGRQGDRVEGGAVRVLAVGSPHGDDRAGWEVVERLCRERRPGIEAAVLSEPLRLMEHLDGCGRLVIVDACRSGAEPGKVVRLNWPDGRLANSAGPSTHGFGVATALALAEALGRL